jgi:O-antigen/teichoic acid export membrane protein
VRRAGTRELLPASVARNASVLTAATVVARLSMFALGIVLARTLGASDYGRYSLALAIGIVLQPIADFGISRYLSRETARDRASTEGALPVLVAAKFALLIATYGAALAVAALAVDDRALLALIAVMVLAALVDGWSMFAYGYFQGREAMGVEARTTTFSALARGGGAITLVLTTGSLALVVAWILLVAVIQAAAATLALRSALGADTRLRPGRHGGRVDWRSVAAMGLVSIFVITYLRVDTVLMGWLLDERAVGLYAAAYTLMLGAQVFPAMLTTALQPVFARTFGADGEAFERTWHVGLRALMLVTLPIAVAVSLTSEAVIARFFGPEFARSAGVLAVVIWICPVVAASLAAQGVLRGARRESTLTWISGTCALVNVVFNIWAISRYGIIGAAVVTVATEALNVLLLLTVVLRGGLVPPPRGPWLRIAVAAAATAVVAVATAAAPVELTLAAAFAAYVIVLALTGVLRGDDLAMLRGLAGRR